MLFFYKENLIFLCNDRTIIAISLWKVSMRRILFSLLLLIFSTQLWATTVEGLRVASGQSGTRVVFDLQGPASYKLFSLANPERLVIDIKHSQIGKNMAIPDVSNTAIRKVRHANWNKNTLRFVLDLNKKLPYSSQVLLPSDEQPYRLVIDLADAKPTLTPAPQPVEKPVKTIVEPVKTVEPAPPKVVKTIKQSKRRDIVVAIDPGHGGQDSGALGKRGTKEKDVVLAIAKKLAKLVDKEPGMKSYLTRNKDVFIPLRRRIKLAHDNGADMFISIHADAFNNPKAKGASVYVLSERGASSEAAKLLADKENAADLAGGISLEDKDDLLATVLLDLSQTASLEGSLEVGNTVLSGLKRVGSVHKKHVESAAFVVLKSPDIPSILVETAFISNPSEEKKLRSPSHQNKLAKAMMVGIRNYFQRNPLPGQQLPQQHIVARGDTLSTIAQRYQVSMADIKTSNNLRTSHLKVGEVLMIP
jgi:N-acetylmuramoyl-L-alanine amidase